MRPLLALLLLAACGDPVPVVPPVTPDRDGGVVISPSAFDGGTCTASITQHASTGASHVPQGTPLTYNSNPPSGGDHYGSWYRWTRTYEPITRGNYLHNEEHGGVVLLNPCASGCDAVTAELQRIGRALPHDPLCLDEVNARWLVGRDPELPDDIAVAAAAWGWTFTATCVDSAKIQQFIDDHYGDAPEALCFDGTL